MPTPAQILYAANPVMDSKTKAIESLDRILIAVKKYGYPNPKEAQVFLTPKEWEFVSRRGGWEKICQSPENNLRDPIVYAQARESIQAEHSTASKGLSYALPASPETNQVFKEINNIKTIKGSI